MVVRLLLTAVNPVVVDVVGDFGVRLDDVVSSGHCRSADENGKDDEHGSGFGHGIRAKGRRWL